MVLNLAFVGESSIMTRDGGLRRILDTAKTVAIVGLSARPDRPSYGVAAYLKTHGYRIVPVNPKYRTVLGERAYADLLSIPEPVDLVLLFRRSEEVQPHVEEAIEIGAKTVWMQLGIVNEEAAAVARRAGLEVVMDACMKIEHLRWIGPGLSARGEPTGG